MEFFLDFHGVAELAEKYYYGAEAAERMKPVMGEIAANMIEIEEQVFASQGRRGGGSWKPLKENTVFKKGSSVILIDHGDLFDSVARVGSKFQILNIGDYDIEFGSEAPGAGPAQTGAPSRNIPVRPFLRFTAADRQHWVDMILDHLMRTFKTTEVGETSDI